VAGSFENWYRLSLFRNVTGVGNTSAVCTEAAAAPGGVVSGYLTGFSVLTFGELFGAL